MHQIQYTVLSPCLSKEPVLAQGAMKAFLLYPWLDPLLMLEKYLPSKLYSEHQQSQEKTMKWYFSDIASVYQTSSTRGKKRGKEAMEVGHDSWLTVMWCCFEEREWGTSTVLPVKDFCWSTEDVSLDLYWWGISAFGCPSQRILFCALE